MNKNIIYIAVTLIVLGLIAIGLRALNKNNPAQTQDQGQETVTPTTKTQTEIAAETPSVRSVVLAFGSKMQNVNTQSSPTVLKAAIRDNYGSYVDPQLIVDWERGLAPVPGRNTSSPWPARIDIASITAAGNNAYVVKGKVVEVTSKEVASGGIAASYNVTIRLELEAGTWLITKFEQAPYDAMPSPATVRGDYVCLPHKDTSGPSTLECAYGIKADTGYYALDMSGLAQGTVPAAETGERVEVTGTFTPIELLSSTSVAKYDVQGVIKVTSFKKL